ncbi:hypothetical protein SD71_17625 [Cohnella kolymensis]|uniref:Uncharacterized protein n=1 Tax=Cohnella kolymensis TaxID=1590652 RepID=A0ABR5A1C6_9BACL|nr:hypothetical protein [Cohnella kolymensis]KIL34830.1 hypothetical protein SD71_17625 [Cohnella kolymensis]
MRLEQIKKHAAGEKKLLETVVWPVFKSFDGFILEHEILSLTGVKIYIDAVFEPLGFAEADGFVVHAENITLTGLTLSISAYVQWRCMATGIFHLLRMTWINGQKSADERCMSLLADIPRV